MRKNFLDTQEATVKWFAARDARMRNIANASLYTDKQKVRAERMKLACELVYAAKGVHVNYRKTKIAVKVDGAIVKNRKELRAIEADWAKQGVVKTASAQGVIYSFS